MVLLQNLLSSSPHTWYILLTYFIWTFEIFNRVMVSISNSLYVKIERYFPPKPKCYHERSVLGDSMILLLLLFVLIQQMWKEWEKTNWLWIVREGETTRTKNRLNSLVVEELSVHLSWNLCQAVVVET